ncbi:hypothetical protein [Jidongwangia harbinensis]|uniref:hypothetical protein n=1 Tax=Jidongwangia harbinensis TaxID=2878561 RepID=UPI001CDA2950|nr:hypothetical protein [Jidongwangia harbinensis]MCA2216811.1 hypothetical protein [Jidongwangia harbinensis]
MTQHEHLEAFGDEDVTDGDSDFASEHADTVVDKTIPGERDDAESESPKGWSGMDSDGPP